MKKSSTIRARMEPDLKDKVEYVFRKLGLTTTQALTLFYKQVELRNGLPFDVVIPNETTRRTFTDTDSERNLVVCEDADDMFKEAYRLLDKDIYFFLKNEPFIFRLFNICIYPFLRVMPWPLRILDKTISNIFSLN